MWKLEKREYRIFYGDILTSTRLLANEISDLRIPIAIHLNINHIPLESAFLSLAEQFLLKFRITYMEFKNEDGIINKSNEANEKTVAFSHAHKTQTNDSNDRKMVETGNK